MGVEACYCGGRTTYKYFHLVRLHNDEKSFLRHYITTKSGLYTGCPVSNVKIWDLGGKISSIVAKIVEPGKHRWYND
jgi:hypothetical protein